MKAMIINGSPRKRMNTAQLLTEAGRGAQEAGAEIETVHLYDLAFTGCKGCMACKMKGTRFAGRCALKDGLTPVLESCAAADVVIMGSPIYFSYPTGEFRCFLERFLFPIDTYLVAEAGNLASGRIKLFEGVKPCGIIYTMNCPESLAGQIGYPQIMEPNRAETERLYGYCEDLWSYDTYQVKDYSRYDINMFDEGAKRKQREQQFPRDLQAAYALGMRLVERARG